MLTPPQRSTFTPLHTGQARLAACHVAASRIQLQDWVSQPEQWWRDTREVLRDTIRVLADLVQAVDAPDPHAAPLRGDSTGQFGIRLDAILDAPEAFDDRVGDLAFVAAGQLRRKLEMLEETHRAFEAGPPSAMLSAHFADAIGSGLRHVLRATCVVEPELARLRGMTARLSSHAERSRSVAVRRAFTTFRRSVALASLDREGALSTQRALRALVHDVAYRDVRPSDRVQIEALSARVDDALDRGAPGLELERLVSDAASFGAMLRVIAHREELLAHDLEVLPRAIAQIADLIGRGKPTLRGHLESIRGIDDEVEALLDPGKDLDGPTLLEQLERVLDERTASARGGFA